METLSLDWETRSVVDLRDCGAYIYAEHPSTSIVCLGYHLPGFEDVRIWRPLDGDTFPAEVLDWTAAGKPVRAWNATFERLIWNAVLTRSIQNAPVMAIEQTYCTMTESLAMALPGRLSLAAKVLGLEQRKDDAGGRVMKQISKPRAPRKNENPVEILWWEDPEKNQQVYDYCKQDVRTELAAAKKIRRLDHSEQRMYWLDQHINDRGIFIDVRNTFFVFKGRS